MASNLTSEAAKLRARLNHPVIDSDGHWVEFGPQVNDYLRQVGGAKAVEGFKSRPTEDWHLTIPLKERRERRLDQPVGAAGPAHASTHGPATKGRSEGKHFCLCAERRNPCVRTAASGLCKMLQRRS